MGIQHRQRVTDQIIEGIGRGRRRALAMAPCITADHAVVGFKQWHLRIPHRLRRAQAVEQQKRGRVLGTRCDGMKCLSGHACSSFLVLQRVCAW